MADTNRNDIAWISGYAWRQCGLIEFDEADFCVLVPDAVVVKGQVEGVSLADSTDFHFDGELVLEKSLKDFHSAQESNSRFLGSETSVLATAQRSTHLIRGYTCLPYLSL